MVTGFRLLKSVPCLLAFFALATSYPLPRLRRLPFAVSRKRPPHRPAEPLLPVVARHLLRHWFSFTAKVDEFKVHRRLAPGRG